MSHDGTKSAIMMKYEKVFCSTEAAFTCYLRGEPEFPYKWHYHSEYELIAITASKGKRYVGDDVSDYVPGDIILIGPEIPHAWQSDDDSGKPQEAIVVLFDYEFLGETLFDHYEFRKIRMMLERSARGLTFAGEKSKHAHSRMKDLLHMDGLDRVLALLSILDELASISDSTTLSSDGFRITQSQSSSERVNNALKYMYEHLGGDLKQKDVADAANMSPAGFSRFFKSCTGLNFIDCLNDMRVGYACRLLMETDMTISEICFKAGFRNLSNFNRQFLKHRKLSPRKYRNAHKKTGVSGK